MRYDWYQSGTTVTVEFFVKGLKEGTDYKVHFEEQNLTVELTHAAECQRLVLAGTIVPAECSVRVTPMKLVVSLKKATPENQWTTLEVCQGEEEASSLAYPSSSKIKHDWAALERSAELATGEEEPQSVDHFFKKLYANADEGTRRAMAKSFVPSIDALSTGQATSNHHNCQLR